MMLAFLSRAAPRAGAARARALFVTTLVCAFAPSVAHAYCRTTTVELPPSYNPASRGCFTDGLYLYWAGQCVGYSINQAASATVPLEDAKRIIDEAFARWMAVTCPKSAAPPGITVSDLGTVTCSQVRYNQDTPNQNLIVFRDTSWPYNDPNNTLGLTTVTFDANTGEIFDADMEINASAHNLSITDQVPANGFDLASVITHEAGHFLGLAHATAPTSTMFASYKPGTIALRTLSEDDINGLCAIYPDSATRIVTKTSAPGVAVEPRVEDNLDAGLCDPTPRHGLTSQCVTPKPTEEKCSASAASGRSWGGGVVTGAGLYAAAAMLAVRRSRRRRRRMMGSTARSNWTA
jgi:hypothetical protein